MKFYSTQDIESLAAQGKKELILDERTVLTDLARDMARQLGITIVKGSQVVAARHAPASGEHSQTNSAIPAKPKGCQHGSLTNLRRETLQPNGSKASSVVVDQLVELVRQSNHKPSQD